MGLTYDLHIHSCLSPCGDDEMTPHSIAGMAALSGTQVIAICDHNAADNLPAAQVACRRHGIRLLPGLEMNTAEEIHLLCYLPTVEAALALSAEIYQGLPALPWREDVFGHQLVVDSQDQVTGRRDKLLLGASHMDLYAAVARTHQLGGLAVPAHIDRDSYSVLSVLGMLPDDLFFPLVELHDPAKEAPLRAAGILPAATQVITSSDAHYLWDIFEHPHTMAPHCPLLPLVEGLA